MRAGDIGVVPAPLRDSHYARAGEMGHGVGYIYPHDVAQGVAGQQYLPEPLKTARYYQPSPHGEESNWLEIWKKIRSLLGRD